MNTIAKLAVLGAVMAATGCIKDYEYEGEYEMTYDVVLELGGAAPRVEAHAGLAAVEIHEGFHEDFYVDLGASFCLLGATKSLEYDPFTEWPWLDIARQECWFSHGGATVPILVSGSATYHDDTELVTVDLAGTYVDDKTGERGAVTIQLSQRWD